MPNIRAPRRGSLQFWPRKRAKRGYARVRNWHGNENKILGFAGYKVGMSHVGINEISYPVTIIACPPLRVFGIRFYKLNPKIAVADLYNKDIDKELSRKTKISNGKETNDFDDIKILVHTQPKLAGVRKKKPEVFELGLGGNKEEKLILARSLLGKEIKVGDVFQKGKFVDVHAVSKGKGFQGTVKRFGVAIRQHKSEKTKRGIGTLGSWTPKRVQYSVPQSGKMGYHLRTEFNKLIIEINKENLNPKSGFNNYGLIKNDYLLLKGSVVGSKKRLIIITEPSRNMNKKQIDTTLEYVAIRR